MSCLAINDVQHRACNSCLFNVISFGGPAKEIATVDLFLREDTKMPTKNNNRGGSEEELR
eukprot:4998948-Amphidinium_carterae.1